MTHKDGMPQRNHRELARLMHSQPNGITAFVQKRVHSTSIGEEDTRQFLRQLLDNLEDAINEYLPADSLNILDDSDKHSQLTHEQEVELGTLLSAASLSIRYVTERAALVPELSRFHHAFATVLRFPSWETSYLGLKAVALMGSTRILEAFGEHMPGDAVIYELRWLAALFESSETFAVVPTTKINYLIRPFCEYITVAVQTHVASRQVIYSEILGKLVKLLTKIENTGTKENGIADPVKTELMSTVAVLLEQILRSTTTNVWALIPLPSFVGGNEESEDNGAAEVDQEQTPRCTIDSLDENDLRNCTHVACSWLTDPNLRTVAAMALPALNQALLTIVRIQPASMLISTLDDIVVGLNTLKLERLKNFEFVNTLLESIRDICTRIRELPISALENLYYELRNVMPRLENAIKSPNVDKKELRAIKGACSTIRQTLVEAFMALIHNKGIEASITLQVDFIENVAIKLADPRVYGDALFVLRRVEPSGTGYESCLEHSVGKLCATLTQIDRYSKIAASRIFAAVTRIASVCKQDIGPFADEMVAFLLPLILDSAHKGRPQRLRVEAVGSILLACSQDPGFKFDDHPWVDDFLGFLLDPVSMGNAHFLMVLTGLVEAEERTLTHVANLCVKNHEVIGHCFHVLLAQWPIYEEDVDVVITTLRLFSALLRVDYLHAALHIDVISATILRLAENAEEDGFEALAASCREVLSII